MTKAARKGQRANSASTANSMKDDDESVDLAEMSPQSRKRHQSRMSSARLRERQRQRITQAEDDIARLEQHVHSLEESIAQHRQGQQHQGASAAVSTGNTWDNTSSSAHADSGSGNSSDMTLDNSTSVDKRARSISKSLSRAVDRLEGCVDRIEMLRGHISQKVENLERSFRYDDEDEGKSPSPLALPQAMRDSDIRNAAAGVATACAGPIVRRSVMPVPIPNTIYVTSSGSGSGSVSGSATFDGNSQPGVSTAEQRKIARHSRNNNRLGSGSGSGSASGSATLDGNSQPDVSTAEQRKIARHNMNISRNSGQGRMDPDECSRFSISFLVREDES
ncbi:hypothetical protein GGI25_004484 [Coemansia spiralis]|uniref:BZIP domain-containing protein n=2 Tax=Coemansia TaxID=4863 RepID=A0A9W8G0A9_9FUNG|nr:hypothetical protein EDC05_005240 [Coemansia umbellata]KAJ2619832.1 hypothetical protein GGI26_005506 [Coemansia sp. RSA 1358]KAJ2673999.1 hypothetical protein GGI25_004484 [Coemansia spiralis]